MDPDQELGDTLHSAKPTEAARLPDGTLIVESNVPPSGSDQDPCYWPALNHDLSQDFNQEFITYTQLTKCDPLVAKGSVQTSKFGGGEWTWDIVFPPLPSEFCNENSAPTANPQLLL